MSQDMSVGDGDGAVFGPQRRSKTEELRSLAESTPVGQIMTRSVVCLAADARLDSVTTLFLERGISSAPVVDENWQAQGMVSKTDLLRIFLEEGMEHRAGDQGTPAATSAARVRDVTAPDVLSLHEEAPISVAAALMAYEGVHRLPIVSSGGEVVGVISTLDIIRWVARCVDLEVGG